MNKSDCFFFGIITGGLLFIVIVSILNFVETPITPMDVYQGNTTLKYEVVDGVKVDSTVVLKDDFKK